MKNLVLSVEKADQLGDIFARTLGIQIMIMDFVKQRKFDSELLEPVVKHFDRQIAHLRHYLLNFERIEVPADQYREGRLNGVRLALCI